MQRNYKKSFFLFLSVKLLLPTIYFYVLKVIDVVAWNAFSMASNNSEYRVGRRCNIVLTLKYFNYSFVLTIP